MNYDQLLDDMRNCEQTKGLSVYDHGRSVYEYYKDLRNHIEYGEDLKYEWKLPEWIHDEIIWENQSENIDTYHILHDCGKPYCRTVDEHGKVHFPDHANVSADTYLSLNGNKTETRDKIANLIRRDMEIHLLKEAGIQDFIDRGDALTLLVTGLCEIHSNCAMFGGIDSISFKMKWKAINKRGKSILKRL